MAQSTTSSYSAEERGDYFDDVIQKSAIKITAKSLISPFNGKLQSP